MMARERTAVIRKKGCHFVLLRKEFRLSAEHNYSSCEVARVKCKDCGEEYIVAFSCRQRSCCPSCAQKRALLLGHRLKDEVLAPVPHRQWVFTIPKRLRIYFRYDRSLLGKLCRMAWETVRDVYAIEVDGECGIPAMVGAVQTFGDLIHWHPHS